jgi:hypothetical protein
MKLVVLLIDFYEYTNFVRLKMFLRCYKSILYYLLTKNIKIKIKTIFSKSIIELNLFFFNSYKKISIFYQL